MNAIYSAALMLQEFVSAKEWKYAQSGDLLFSVGESSD